ncbi:MAG: hypothetical protein K6G49_00595 [Candidatus Saccharibacteria bacterium]|nr:hypothetical protein [Candidatus Saccharibacteria bacterium]
MRLALGARRENDALGQYYLRYYNGNLSTNDFTYTKRDGFFIRCVRST